MFVRPEGYTPRFMVSEKKQKFYNATQWGRLNQNRHFWVKLDLEECQKQREKVKVIPHASEKVKLKCCGYGIGEMWRMCTHCLLKGLSIIQHL